VNKRTTNPLLPSHWGEKKAAPVKLSSTTPVETVFEQGSVGEFKKERPMVEGDTVSQVSQNPAREGVV